MAESNLTTDSILELLENRESDDPIRLEDPGSRPALVLYFHAHWTIGDSAQRIRLPEPGSSPGHHGMASETTPENGPTPISTNEYPSPEREGVDESTGTKMNWSPTESGEERAELLQRPDIGGGFQ